MADGSVRVNDNVFATVTVVEGEEPVFLNAAGEPLSGVEIANIGSPFWGIVAGLISARTIDARQQA